MRLIIGSDLPSETPRWRDFAGICRIAPPIIVPRAGYIDKNALGPALPPISSTEIRNRIRLGLEVERWLPYSVAEYIRVNRLYL